MNEEIVTKTIIKNLKDKGGNILAFDYPQSGMGVPLNPDIKHLPSVTLDIIAMSNGEILFFENKDRYYPKDFEKLYKFKNNFLHYNESFKAKFGLDLKDYSILTCIGIPESAINKVKPDKRRLVDRIWRVKNVNG